MATSALDPGTAADTSLTITVTTTPVTVCLYSAAADLPNGLRFKVRFATPANPTLLGVLTEANPAMVLGGPGDYTVERPATAVAVGVCYSTAA